MTPLPNNHPVAVHARCYLAAREECEVAGDALARSRKKADYHHEILLDRLGLGGDVIVEDARGNLHRVSTQVTEAAGVSVPFVAIEPAPAAEVVQKSDHV